MVSHLSDQLATGGYAVIAPAITAVGVAEVALGNIEAAGPQLFTIDNAEFAVVSLIDTADEKQQLVESVSVLVGGSGVVIDLPGLLYQVTRNGAIWKDNIDAQ